MSPRNAARTVETVPFNPPKFTQPFSRTRAPRGTEPPKNIDEVDLSSALTASLVKPVVDEKAHDPKTLWTRANFMNHVKNAADVQVQVRMVGPVVDGKVQPTLLKVQKSFLLAQLKEYPANSLFPAPEGRWTDVGLVLILV